MLTDAPTIGDMHEWFDQLVFLPIDQAAMLFFSKLGFLSGNEVPLVAACEPSRFVYALLPEDKLLSDKDRLSMEATEACAKLVTFFSTDYDAPSTDVDIYAVELKYCESTRSEDAYNIHELTSRFNSHPSIIFFRCAEKVMLSFLQYSGRDRLSIRLSDWLAADSIDDGQIDRLSVVSCSLSSAYDLFDSMEFEAIRHYYKYPITRYIAAYDVVFQSINLSLMTDYSGFTKEAQNDAIQKVLDTYPNIYGDDYIDDEIIEIDKDDDINLDDLEWEAQKLDLAEDRDDVEDGPVDNDDVIVDHYQLPPSEVLDNPIALLEWLDSHQEPQAVNKGSVEPAERHAVPIGKNPPPVGSHIRHIRLGEGIVNGIQGGLGESCNVYVSAIFGDTARTFLFPNAFENGLVRLLS